MDHSCVCFIEPTLTTLRRLLKAFTLNGELCVCVCACVRVQKCMYLLHLFDPLGEGQVLYKIVDYIEQHPHVLQPTSDDDRKNT